MPGAGWWPTDFRLRKAASDGRRLSLLGKMWRSGAMTRRFLMMASVAALLAGCAIVPSPPILAPAGAPLAELEPLYAAEAGRRELTIKVASNGCTTKADFAFYVERQGEAVTLAFGRRRLDGCQSLVAGHVELAFSYAELGLEPRDPVFLLNPLVAWPGL